MLKNVALGLILASFLMVSESCKKTKEAIDCFGESLLVSMTHTADGSNPKKVDFTINYSGDFEFQNVKWEYGDGATETISGKTASHTYAEAGTYEVRWTVTIKHDKETCSPSYQKSITVD